MMMTFTEFLPALFEALGGEEIPQGSKSGHKLQEESQKRQRGAASTVLLHLRLGA